MVAKRVVARPWICTVCEKPITDVGGRGYVWERVVADHAPGHATLVDAITNVVGRVTFTMAHLDCDVGEREMAIAQIATASVQTLEEWVAWVVRQGVES